MPTQKCDIINQITYNPFLLAKIFNFLTCEEQLKFTKICDIFRHVILRHIWKTKYKSLHVLEFMSKYMILKVVPNEVLNGDDYKDFLSLNVDHVRELYINTFSMLNKRSLMLELDLRFGQLIKMTVRDVKFTEDNVRNLSKSFPRLKYIQIKNCFRPNGAAIHTLADFSCDIFESLSFLEELKIDNIFQNVYVRK